MGRPEPVWAVVCRAPLLLARTTAIFSSVQVVQVQLVPRSKFVLSIAVANTQYMLKMLSFFVASVPPGFNYGVGPKVSQLERSDTGVKLTSVARSPDAPVRRPDSSWTVDASSGNILHASPAHDLLPVPSVSNSLAPHQEVSPLADLAVQRPDSSFNADSALPSYTGTILGDGTQTGPLDTYDVQMNQASSEETAHLHDSDETGRGI